VINRTSKYLYSIPYFFDGNPGTVWKPVFGNARDKQYWTVEEHMNERMSQWLKRAL
jgi:isopenicillin N synthase-like dioxygenase